MSRSQLARTPRNFPRMKHRAAGRLLQVGSWGGGMVCPCGTRIMWGKVGREEYAKIQAMIEDHEAWCDEGLGY